MKTLIKNGTIVTMNEQRDIIKGDVLIEGDKISKIGNIEDSGTAIDKVIDATGKIVIPGLIQTHIHLCQSLFRGQADDLELLDWLKNKIWPLEGAHDSDSIYYSAMLGCGEMFKGGTTAIIDMETVRHTQEAIAAIKENGMRAIVGKVMMDYGQGVPDSLMEDTDKSIAESVELLERWHNSSNGRIKYGFAPRFVISCTEKLLIEVRDLAQKYDVHIHTHASENRGEIQIVEADRGMRNIIYLDKIGLTGPNLILAHCIWLNDEEIGILARSKTKVAHCPSSNLKLASGIAKVPELMKKGALVSIGADGAPCNNNLDQFVEMRTAALIQKPIHGPTSMPAPLVFELATLGGARAMGLEKEIGSIEEGKKADIAIIDLDNLHTNPTETVDLYSQLVYQAKSTDVIYTIVDGKIVMENRQLTTIDEKEIKTNCNKAIVRIAERAGVI
ncbi:MAG: 5'-deoxyadenosine deaminase [Bacillota bacterium]|nr:5'-deoxyadenosine deaminase [Bacillota bacterium]